MEGRILVESVFENCVKMFQYGDILAVVNQDDPNWWQARLAEEEGSEYTQAKLIPSRELEEKRKAFVKPEADYTTKVRQKYIVNELPNRVLF